MYRLILLLVIVFLLGNCSKNDDENDNPKGTVTYEVNCDKTGLFITYFENGYSYQKDIETSNWQINFEAFSGDYVYLQAMAKNPDENLSIKIEWKNKIFKQKSAEGNFPQASITGYLD
ncbi:MAG: hypothetical protein H8E34_06070 [Bacteroidetes bacterium]|nr:hypothetical protein [Bacteroidota bacterium]